MKIHRLQQCTLGGATVTPGDGDLKYIICNEANLRALNNKNITITNDGVLSVTADAVPQTITVRGTNKSGSVQGTVKIQILPANMNTGNEDKYTDTYIHQMRVKNTFQVQLLKKVHGTVRLITM